MFQDDRMIPVLTAVLLMVVVGTFLQRAQDGTDPAGPVALQLVDDEVTAPAGTLVRIDPLANDIGLTDGMRAGLTVVTAPACGRLLVRNGVFEYMAGEACSGRQTIRYTVADASNGQLATVTARILGGGRPGGGEAPPAVVAGPVVATGGEARTGDAAAEPAAAPSARSPTADQSAPEPAVVAAAPRTTEAARVSAATGAGASEDRPLPVASTPGMTDPAGPQISTTAPPGSALVNPSTTDTATGSPPRLAIAPDHTAAPAIAAARESAPASSLAAAATGNAARTEPEIAVATPSGTATGAPPRIGAATPGAVPADRTSTVDAPGAEGPVATGLGEGTPDREIATAALPAATTSGPANHIAGAPTPAPDREARVGEKASEASAAAPAGSGTTDASSSGSASGSTVAEAAAPGLLPSTPGKAAGQNAGDGTTAADARPNVGIEAAGPSGTGIAAVDAREPDSAEVVGALPDNASSAGPDEGDSGSTRQNVAMTSLPVAGRKELGDAAPAGPEHAPEAPPEIPVVLASLAPPAAADGPAFPAGPGAPVRIASPASMYGPTAPAVPGSGTGRPGVPPSQVADAGAGAAAGFMMTVAGRAPHAAPPAASVTWGAADAPAPAFPAAIAPGADVADAASDAPEVARLAPPLREAPPVDPSLALTGYPMLLPPPRPASRTSEGQVRTARLDPAAIGAAGPGAAALGQAAPARTVPATGGTRLARLPDQTASCVTAPAMTLEVRNAGETVVSVTAPCHAATIAELSYSGLRFAVPIDDEGHGQITALGFEPNAPALLSFADGGQIDFDLPFKGVGRISRVALAWEVPVDLALNALEYNAAPYSAGHVAPRRPRSFAEVRRTGGGWLSTYGATAGVGQNVQIYSWWHRQGEEPGVVRLLVDFVSRQLGAPGTCGGGAVAAPQFLVLRSDFGRPERPLLRQLAPVGCASVPPEGDQALISGAVEDLVITDR